jgi:2',5'-phosphodiesterase
VENPGEHFLLSNTHLFFHPEADFIRLLQAVVCTKYLEKLKHDLLYTNNSDNKIKNIRIIFSGDFNSDPPSHAFTYIFTQSIPYQNLNEGNKTSKF